MVKLKTDLMYEIRFKKGEDVRTNIIFCYNLAEAIRRSSNIANSMPRGWKVDKITDLNAEQMTIL